MTNCRTLIILAGVILTLESVGHAQMRTWHDTKAGEMRGSFVSVLTGTVTLSGDLRNVEIPFWNLDSNVQLWILRHIRSRRKRHLVPKVSDFPRKWKTVGGRPFLGQLLQSDHREVVIVIDAQKVKFDLKAMSPADIKYVNEWPGPIPGMVPIEPVSETFSETEDPATDQQESSQSKAHNVAGTTEESAAEEETQESGLDRTFEEIGTVLELSS